MVCWEIGVGEYLLWKGVKNKVEKVNSLKTVSLRMMGHVQNLYPGVFKIYAPENKSTNVQMKAPLSNHLTQKSNGETVEIQICITAKQIP